MSLTGHLRDATSPVRQFFNDNFPDAKPARMSCTVPASSPVLLMQGLRRADVPRSGTWNAGDARVCPKNRDGYPWSTVGTAFGHELNILLGMRDRIPAAAIFGARKLAMLWALQTEVPRSFSGLVKFVVELRRADSNWANPTSPDGKRKVAQVSYALALFEECYRSPVSLTWPLLRLGRRAGLHALFGSIPDDALEDLTQLADVFIQTQPDLLTADKLVFEPRFEAADFLAGADGDLIAGGRLLDIKTKVNATISKTDLWQLLGYALSDFSDAHTISEVGFYFSRHGVQVAWDIGTLMELMSGVPQDLSSVREHFRDTLEALDSFRIADIEDPPAISATNKSVLPAELIKPIDFEPAVVTRNRSTETIRRSLPFRPMRSGTGKWHVACADNLHVRPPSGLENLGILPSCGSLGELDVSAAPLTLELDAVRGDLPEVLCSRCLDMMTGEYFYPAYTAPIVGPPERWRFHEPVNRGQKWHITRDDFYSQDVVNGGEKKGVCNAYGGLKPAGEALPVAAIDETDPKYCRRCLTMVKNGGNAR